MNQLNPLIGYNQQRVKVIQKWASIIQWRTVVSEMIKGQPSHGLCFKLPGYLSPEQFDFNSFPAPQQRHLKQVTDKLFISGKCGEKKRPDGIRCAKQRCPPCPEQHTPGSNPTFPTSLLLLSNKRPKKNNTVDPRKSLRNGSTDIKKLLQIHLLLQYHRLNNTRSVR